MWNCEKCIHHFNIGGRDFCGWWDCQIIISQIKECSFFNEVG